MTSKEGQADYLRDMFTEAEEPDTGTSEIASFYAGKNVLITGASGFFGRLLVDKILRSCPDVGKIYLLMRPKKGKDPKLRFDEYFDDVVFGRLKKERPKYYNKVALVEGDVGEIGLALSLESRKLLQDTNVIIHCAATVRFDAKLRIAVNINVRGTKELLLLAKDMANLKAFVHVSTAYSQCIIDEIDEKFYPIPMSPENLISLVDILDDDVLDSLTPSLLGKWPNTYAFTKAAAEDIVRQWISSEIPICIVRPSIVIPTYREPIPGWINNIYGPTGVCVGAGIGLLRTIFGNTNLVTDIIPADYVINLIIAAAWDIAKAKSIAPNGVHSVSEIDDAEGLEPPIFNGVSSCQKPITFTDYLRLNFLHGEEVQSVHVMWYFMLFTTTNWWLYKILVFFLHLVPAAIVDSLAYVTGKEPGLWRAYEKVHKFNDVISFFAMQKWQFQNKRVLALWDRTNATDRKLFDFNIESLVWDEYFYHHIRGLRVFIVKDPMDTVPQGNAKYAKLKIAHFTLVTFLVVLLLWAILAILRTLGLF